MVRHQLESMLRKGGVDCLLDHGDVNLPPPQHPGSPRAAAIVRDLSEKRAEADSLDSASKTQARTLRESAESHSRQLLENAESRSKAIIADAGERSAQRV